MMRWELQLGDGLNIQSFSLIEKFLEQRNGIFEDVNGRFRFRFEPLFANMLDNKKQTIGLAVIREEISSDDGLRKKDE